MTVLLDEFLKTSGPCFDVRSPAEYSHAKIPGAINLPLFSNEERALVGTAYKQQGKDVAIRLGMRIVGPKLEELITSCEKYIQGKAPLRVYCWRGGMRSGFVSYLLQFTGYPTLQLKGGYKAFRRMALGMFSTSYRLKVIGGLTGSGKTEILQAIKQKGALTIDLENLAQHRGSVYGELPNQPQPSNEYFENQLGYGLYSCNFEQPIWVEDESRLIGRCQIPGPFYDAMKEATLYVITSPKDARIQRIRSEYRQFPKELWVTSTQKIAKRLGGAKTQSVLKLIQEDQLDEAIELLLDYYDAAYEYSISHHSGPVVRFAEQDKTADQWADLLMKS